MKDLGQIEEKGNLMIEYIINKCFYKFFMSNGTNNSLIGIFDHSLTVGSLIVNNLLIENMSCG